MSVVIQGMKMPKSCDECDLNYDAFRCILPIKDNEFFSNGHYLETNRLPNCPLVELPPHGRLIDADAPIVLTDAHGREIEVTVSHIIERNGGEVVSVIEAEGVSE